MFVLKSKYIVGSRVSKTIAQDNLMRLGRVAIIHMTNATYRMST